MGSCESDNNKANSSRCFCCGGSNNNRNNRYNNYNQNPPNQSQNFYNTPQNPPSREGTQVNTNNSNISDSNITNEIPIDNTKRNLFINNYINKNIESINGQDLRDGLFIKAQKKIMKISENSIMIEMECFLSVKVDNPNVYYDNIWFPLDYKVNELRSKEVYVDDIKINDNDCESKETLIKIDLGKMSNGQSRKFKVIYEIEKKF